MCRYSLGLTGTAPRDTFSSFIARGMQPSRSRSCSVLRVRSIKNIFQRHRWILRPSRSPDCPCVPTRPTRRLLESYDVAGSGCDLRVLLRRGEMMDSTHCWIAGVRAGRQDCTTIVFDFKDDARAYDIGSRPPFSAHPTAGTGHRPAFIKVRSTRSSPQSRIPNYPVPQSQSGPRRH